MGQRWVAAGDSAVEHKWRARIPDQQPVTNQSAIHDGANAAFYDWANAAIVAFDHG